MIYYSFHKKKLLLISTLAVLSGIDHIPDFISINFGKQKTPESKIKILSYNVRLFNLYKWEETEDIPQKIFSLIKTEQPDILCLQEFYSCRADKFSSFDSIIKVLHHPYYFISNRSSVKGKIKLYGSAIFSKYPIVHLGNINFGKSSRKYIYADIAVGKDTVRIYNTHLASVHLDYDDYRFIDNISENRKDEYLPETLGILRKMIHAYRQRSEEADFLAKKLAKSPYPTVVCADLNDVPVSYTYHTVKGKLKDAFIESGAGFGSTYIRRYSMFRIDYIFHDNRLKSYNFKTIHQKYSDHYPISCEIGF